MWAELCVYHLHPPGPRDCLVGGSEGAGGGCWVAVDGVARVLVLLQDPLELPAGLALVLARPRGGQQARLGLLHAGDREPGEGRVKNILYTYE